MRSISSNVNVLVVYFNLPFCKFLLKSLLLDSEFLAYVLSTLTLCKQNVEKMGGNFRKLEIFFKNLKKLVLF